MFRGSFDHNVDPKGRVSVPSRFREIIAASGSATVVLAPFRVSSVRCLDAYPLAAWERFEHDFRQQKRFDRTIILFENFYLGNAQPCDIDNQGRVLLPPGLREWAKLTKRVVFSGARDKFRIWDREAWEATQVEAEGALEDPEFLGKLNL